MNYLQIDCGNCETRRIRLSCHCLCPHLSFYKLFAVYFCLGVQVLGFVSSFAHVQIIINYYPTYINSRLFPRGQADLHNATCYYLTYSSRLVHIHTSDHSRTPVASTTHLTFLRNLTNKVSVCPSGASPLNIATIFIFTIFNFILIQDTM